MDGGHLLMSAKERLRKSVFEQVVAGQWSLADAAQQLGLSYRQCKRLYSRFRAQGDSGLLHLSRGRPSTRRTSRFATSEGFRRGELGAK